MSINDADRKVLEDNKFTLECESPLEIRSEDGESFATGLCAQMVIESLHENSLNED